MNENEKKKHSNEIMRNVEHGCFTLLGVRATGGFGKEVQTFLNETMRKNS